MNRKNLLIITILLLTGCNQYETGSGGQVASDNISSAGACPQVENPFAINTQQTVKNVILMIGDGMGLAHINAARLTAKQTGKKFSIDQLPTTGLVNTHSAIRLVTDSAAAATALATGYKTKNTVVGLSPDGKKLMTILDAATQKQLATGVIATSSLTHATPAAFIGHVEHREQQAEIAEQILESDIDILLGGGKGFFIPKSSDKSMRDDERDLLKQAKQRYSVIETKRELFTNTKSRVLGLFAKDGLHSSANEPSLAEMTQVALKKLSAHKNGFILIIEGSQIDWAAHHNETDETIKQTLLFDDAVAIALDFAKDNGETLLLVTADHETGGLSVTKGKLDGSELELDWTTSHHTAIDVPIYSYGPQSQSFSGVMDNTCIPKRIAKQLNLHFD